MKRNHWLIAAAYLLAGAAALTAALLTETKLDGIFFGLAGAGLGPGLVLLGQCLYRCKPERARAYEEEQELQRIDREDEFKEMLRGKAARQLCGFHLLVTVLAMVVFTILGSFELVEGSRTVVLYLGGYLALQLVAAAVVYDRLLKKYTE